MARGQVKAITLAPVPDASGFKAYQMEVYMKIIVASTRSFRDILKWIQEIEIAKLRKLEKPNTE